MLVLTRRRGNAIHVGDTIRVVVLEIRNGKVRIGIDAPPSIPIRPREEKPGPDVPGKPELEPTAAGDGANRRRMKGRTPS